VEKLLTCKEVAERYGVKVITVQDWIRTKKLSAVRVGGKSYRIRAEDIEAFERQYETKREEVQ
jgi:excisionase family DNA binding protein